MPNFTDSEEATCPFSTFFLLSSDPSGTREPRRRGFAVLGGVLSFNKKAVNSESVNSCELSLSRRSHKSLTCQSTYLNRVIASTNCLSVILACLSLTLNARRSSSITVESSSVAFRCCEDGKSHKFSLSLATNGSSDFTLCKNSSNVKYPLLITSKKLKRLFRCSWIGLAPVLECIVRNVSWNSALEMLPLLLTSIRLNAIRRV
mmetsp:Transcript_112209/g.175237  ORF Transcript_112209/g.175237 Transcript_112209/m.175237 type:complete len:204 (-) Transcript_112209:984-1595(-)